MKKRLAFFILLFFSIFPLKGVDNLFPESVFSLGAGMQGVTGSAVVNPASAAWLPRKEITLAYFNRYLKKETGTVSAAFFYPHPAVSGGLSLAVFGSGFYRDSRFTCTAGKKLGSYWSIGLSFTYRTVRLSGFSVSPAYFSVGYGVSYRPSGKWRFGIACLNAPAVKTGAAAFRGISRYAFLAGCSWRFLPQLEWHMEAETSYGTPFRGGLGFCFTPPGGWAVRTGIRTEPLEPFCGAGYTFGRFTVDLVAAYHPVLGSSAGASLSYRFL